MKIAQIITRSDTLGGASVHLRDLCLQLKENGHQVKVFIGGKGPVIDVFRNEGIEIESISSLVRPLSPIKDIQACRELRSKVKKYSPDIIACHSAKAGVIGRIVAKSLGVPSIYTAHGWSFTEGVPTTRAALYERIERIMSKYSSNIITVSNYDKQLACKRKVARNEQLRVIWNGIPDLCDSEVMQRKLEQARKSKVEPVHIIMVARFEEPKNYDLLLRSLHRISDTPWRATLVGDGPDLDKMKNLCVSLGLSKKVEFTGWCDTVSEKLASADIFALLSSWEGLPLSVLEAMREGIPVIASGVGGVSEAVEHEKTGFVVRNTDPDIIAQQFKTLIQDSALRTKLGNNGRKRFKAIFTAELMTDKTRKVYEKTIQSYQFKYRNNPFSLKARHYL